MFNIILFCKRYNIYYQRYNLYLKCLLFLYIIILYTFSHKNILISKKVIFTFWEPHEKIPGYLRLCIKTWKKFLPDYEIKILDYKNVKDYIGEKLFSIITYKKMTLQAQSDAIRVALLKKFGGIWMDTDTIITNRKFIEDLQYFNYELSMLGVEKDKSQNIGFISASDKSSILDEWLKKIIRKINYYKRIDTKTNNSGIFNECCYLGNRIIDPLLTKTPYKKYFRIDKYKINALPEIKFFENSSLYPYEKYKLFYFSKREPKKVLKSVKGIILLHNSWTPFKYRKMSEKEFLNQDILLSKLLEIILKG